MSSTPMGAQNEELSWPLLSAAELGRLRFLAYLRQTGRLRPPAPAGAEVEALCAALLRDPLVSQDTSGVQRNAYYGGLPPLWRAWAEQQERRKLHGGVSQSGDATHQHQ